LVQVPAEEVDPVPDAVAMATCILINVVFRGISAELETVATPFLMNGFGLSYDLASYYIASMGFIGLGVYICFKAIARRFSDRLLVQFGLVAAFVGTFPLALSGITANMSVEVYVLCLAVVWSLAYPLGQTAVLSLFSKLLAGLPAGRYLGVFSMGGNIARIVFAVAVANIWSVFGREAVFGGVLLAVALAITGVALLYQRLAPASDDSEGG
jgi:hypothetical protein